MRRVLIISYYWPPAGGVSVHRALKWAKLLPQFGWDVVVYTAENAQYPFFDPEYANKIPQETEVIKHPIREVQSIFKRLSGRKKEHALVSPLQVRNEKSKRFDSFAVWVRSNFFIPDARMLWIKPSVKFLTQYLEDHPVDAIISTGPPHSSNMIGCKLHKKTGIPWLADFQDPWTQADYYSMLKLMASSDKKHKRMEQEVFKNATQITTVSPSWAKDLESIGAKNVVPLYFGFDKDDFTSVTIKKDSYFSIVHAGMLGFDRLPDALFKVLSNNVESNTTFRESLKIRLAGMVDYTVLESINKHKLTDYVELLGNISLDESYSLAFSSNIQLLLLNKAQNAKGRIPGKLFEYLASSKPILCLGPTASDVAEIIGKAASGIVLDYNDEEGINSYISNQFKLFIQAKEEQQQTNDINEYSLTTQTSKLAGLLNDMVK